MVFINVDNAHGLLLAPVALGVVVERTANADLHRAAWVEQAFFDGTAEGRAVRELAAAEVAVPSVGVGVEVLHAQRAAARDGAHHRQRD